LDGGCPVGVESGVERLLSGIHIEWLVMAGSSLSENGITLLYGRGQKGLLRNAEHVATCA
jgi:hypothetical protein